ncbi:caspase family protein [Mesorhizobium sp. M1169]|uniref:caspase family protein n=1 Tax=unclassified Mesorhizobium TaxID=325217 RepID=UPI00333AC78F
MRKALVVGIDHYEHIGGLNGCVNDAFAVKQMLDRHADGSVNFGTPKLLVGTGPADIVERQELKEAVRELFADDSEVALFYFAGHGFIEATGGYLCAGDCKTGDDGLPLSEIMTFANKSPAKNKIIILDSCHSGVLGEHAVNGQLTEISEGVTILTASTKAQYAAEVNGGGVFTGLLIDALGGAAANLIGQVTPGGVYAHIDQSLGSWSQRPVFKTNVKRFVSLRQVLPPLPLADLQRLAEFFPTPGFEYQLDPSFEPTEGAADPNKTAIFAILQKYNRVNLLVPVGALHMWNAAVESRTVKLTATGEHYRHLVAQNLI